MTVPLSHAEIRHSYFRELCARYQHEQREYGGRALEELHLHELRKIWRLAHLKAIEWRYQATHRWNPSTRRWEQTQ